MNPNTRVVICCYQGDAHQVENLRSFYTAHECPVTVMSPLDSPVVLPGMDCKHAGKRAYIGQDSLDRQKDHMRLCLGYPEEWFFLCDPDSFCLSPEFPGRLYADGKGTIWSNEVVEPRPHESPYDKIACQPPYFLHRDSLARMLEIPITAHPITPYIDYVMLEMSARAGITRKPFTLLEHAPVVTFHEVDPWKTLEFRIRHCGTVMMHPVKSFPEIEFCAKAYRGRW